MSKKLYSQLAMAVDLVSFEYQTSNPVILAEKMHEDLGIEYSIHQISDYLDVDRFEDYDKQSRKIECGLKNF